MKKNIYLFVIIIIFFKITTISIAEIQVDDLTIKFSTKENEKNFELEKRPIFQF